MEAQKVQAQLEAVLKSTGHAAGFNSEQIQMMASAYQRQTTFSDEAVLSAQNMLLTFTNIKGPVFQGATQAVLDMATALGEDATDSAMRLGKALNDPIGGVTALRRAGVQLTDQQEEQIKKMVELGDVAGAQNIILKELSTEFGGSAAAAADTFGGRLTRLKNQFGELQERVGFMLLPILTKLVGFLANNLPGAIALGEKAAAELALVFEQDVRPVLEHIGRVVEGKLWPVLKQVFDTIIQFTGHKAAILAVGAAITALFTAWAIGAAAAAVSTIAATAPLAALILAIAGLGAGLVLLEEKTGLVSATFEVLGQAAHDTWQVVGPLLTDALITLKQGWEDLQPAVEDLGRLLNDHVVPVLSTIGEYLREHPALLVALAAAIAALVAPWLLVVGTIVVVLAKWDEIKAMFTQAIPAAIDSVIAKIKELPIIGAIFEATFDHARAVTELYLGLIRSRVEFVLTEMKGIVEVVMAVIRGDWGAAWNGMKDMLSGVLSLIKSDVGTFVNFVHTSFRNLFSALVGVMAPLGPVLRGPFDDARSAVQWLIDKVQALINKINSIPSIDLPDLSPGFNAPDVNPLSRSIGGSSLAPQALSVDGMAEAIKRALNGTSVQADGVEIGRLATDYQAVYGDRLSRGG